MSFKLFTCFVFCLNWTANKPKATLRADTTIIPVGGTVRLTCSVKGSAGWEYDWYEGTQPRRNGKVIRVSEGGLYSCIGKRGDPVFFTERSDEVLIQKTGEFSTLFCNTTNLLSTVKKILIWLQSQKHNNEKWKQTGTKQVDWCQYNQ